MVSIGFVAFMRRRRPLAAGQGFWSSTEERNSDLDEDVRQCIRRIKAALHSPGRTCVALHTNVKTGTLREVEA
jgi:hypothetical protein